MSGKFPSFLPWSLAAAAALLFTIVWISSHGDFNEDQQENGHHNHEEHLHGEHESVPLTSEQIAKAGIQVSTAQAAELSQKISGPATLQIHADKIAHLYPKVAGIVKEARKNVGERVKEFELLAILESREAADYKAVYLNALSKEELANALFAQEQALREKGLSTLQEYQNSLEASTAAQLSVKIARQNLYALGMTNSEINQLPFADPSTFGFYELRAPLAGTVLNRNIAIGKPVTPIDELYEIALLTSLWAKISLYPQEIVHLRPGQPVEIQAISGQTGRATLQLIGSTINENTRRIEVIAELDNSSGAWQPGSFVNASISTATTSVPVAVSKGAIQKIDGQLCCFIATKEGFEIRPVETGRSDDQWVEVTAGVQKGERYASSQSFLLKAEHEKDEAEHMH